MQTRTLLSVIADWKEKARDRQIEFERQAAEAHYAKAGKTFHRSKKHVRKAAEHRKAIDRLQGTRAVRRHRDPDPDRRADAARPRPHVVRDFRHIVAIADIGAAKALKDNVGGLDARRDDAGRQRQAAAADERQLMRDLPSTSQIWRTA